MSEQIWLDSYPSDVPRTIDLGEYPSLHGMILFRWSFQTGEQGDFESLARRRGKLGQAPQPEALSSLERAKNFERSVTKLTLSSGALRKHLLLRHSFRRR